MLWLGGGRVIGGCLCCFSEIIYSREGGNNELGMLEITFVAQTFWRAILKKKKKCPSVFKEGMLQKSHKTYILVANVSYHKLFSVIDLMSPDYKMLIISKNLYSNI